MTAPLYEPKPYPVPYPVGVAGLEGELAAAEWLLGSYEHSVKVVRKRAESIRAAIRERDTAQKRYDQCDATCTVDCGHCKGQGPPADADREAFVEAASRILYGLSWDQLDPDDMRRVYDELVKPR